MEQSDELILGEPKKFFISFKDESGGDCAIHLYEFLKNRGIDVFISNRDIEYDMTRGQWRTQIDRALSVTKNFILIITVTATTSEEVIREFEKVKDNDDVGKYIFIHAPLWNNENQTTIELTNESQVNLKTFQAAKFENKHDLVRKVYAAISMIEKIEFAHAC